MRELPRKGNMNDRIDTVLHKFRSRMSSYPPGMCPISLYRSLLQISMNQSCGKCVPCKDGLVEVDRMLHEILIGAADEEAPKRLENMCRMIMETADCAVGISAAHLILDSLEQFADEYESHITHHSCVAQVKQTIPCVTLCPAHVNVPGYVALIKEEDYAGAVRLIRDRNPFPTACAMICEHPCEKRCRRALVDDPINIRGLKKYAIDRTQPEEVANPNKNVSTGKRVAVIGAGPSGLTAAYYLSLMGHAVTVYEEHEKAGGMLRYGIPEYRLPKNDLDRDIDAILAAGDITIHYNTKIGRDISFSQIRETSDAVYLGLGAQIGNRMPVDGADAKNVIPAADFLQLFAKYEIHQPFAACHDVFHLSDHHFFQGSGCACHQDQPAVIAAFCIDSGSQHSTHAVTDDKYFLRVNARILPQKYRGKNGIFYGFFFHGDRSAFIPEHFPAMGKGSLVITDRGNPVIGKTLRQILKWRQFSNLFIHVAGTGTVDKDNCRNRSGCTRRQSQQPVQGIVCLFSDHNFFCNHKLLLLCVYLAWCFSSSCS